jgi:HSP20 family protein
MIRFRYPSAHALRDALEEWLEQPAATSREGDTPIPVDVYQDGTEIVVEASLPGARLEDIELSCEEGLLAIRARIPETPRNYAVHESPSGNLSRIVALPSECSAEDARASLRDGVLRVVVPRPKAATRRAIKVEIASGASQPSKIVMEKTPQLMNAVKGKDYRDVESASPARRKRSK